MTVLAPAPPTPARSTRLTIGDVTLASNLFLCPIAGYCDLAYRRIVREIGGLGLAYTDLVNPRGLKNRTARSLQIVQTCTEDRPMAIQLYGTEADELAEAAKWAADYGSPVVDLNMGCPAKKVEKKGGGSGLLRHCPDAVRLAETVVQACPVPVTVKTRLGWEEGNLVADKLVRQMEDVGVAAMTIHGRYGAQKFRGSCDLDGIAAVVAAARHIPVLGNGDIHGPEDVVRMIERTGCAGVMIGRWALADPWIFRDSLAWLRTGELPTPPSRHERLDRMVRHFEYMMHYLGERTACIQWRKRISWYAKTIGPCKELRCTMPRTESRVRFYELLNAFMDEIGLPRYDPAATLSLRPAEEWSPDSVPPVVG